MEAGKSSGHVLLETQEIHFVGYPEVCCLGFQVLLKRPFAYEYEPHLWPLPSDDGSRVDEIAVAFRLMETRDGTDQPLVRVGVA